MKKFITSSLCLLLVSTGFANPPQMEPLNTIERLAWIADQGSEGNLNFTFISTYQGPITYELLERGLKILSDVHPRLKMHIQEIGGAPVFCELSQFTPFLKAYDYVDESTCQQIVKAELNSSFRDSEAPLWRVAFIQGEQQGKIIMTYHHAISDGVAGAEIMNHLYRILSSLMLNEIPHIEFNRWIPPLSSLDHLIKIEMSEIPPIEWNQVEPGSPYQTSFALRQLDETLSKSLTNWCRNQGVKVNSALFAAYLKALAKVKPPALDYFLTSIAVNLRPFFDHPPSKELMRALFSEVSGVFSVDEHAIFSHFSKNIHADLYRKLDFGSPLITLAIIDKILAQKPTPEQFSALAKSPLNFAGISNIGKLAFDGTYLSNNIKMKDLFFVANSNSLLTDTTLDQRIYLTHIFDENQCSENEASAILLEMENILKWQFYYHEF